MVHEHIDASTRYEYCSEIVEHLDLSLYKYPLDDFIERMDTKRLSYSCEPQRLHFPDPFINVSLGVYQVCEPLIVQNSRTDILPHAIRPASTLNCYYIHSPDIPVNKFRAVDVLTER